MKPTVLNHPSDRYRRMARRLRGRLGDKPGELYQSLRELSDRYDNDTWDSGDDNSEDGRISISTHRSIFRNATPADDFVAQIIEKNQSGVLMYSDRLKLLKAAGEMGIGRFEANLIIAGVQHRYASNRVSASRMSRQKIPALEIAMAFVVVQILIIFLAWVLLFH